MSWVDADYYEERPGFDQDDREAAESQAEQDRSDARYEEWLDRRDRDLPMRSQTNTRGPAPQLDGSGALAPQEER